MYIIQFFTTYAQLYIFLIYKITLEKIHSCPIIKNITLFSEG